MNDGTLLKTARCGRGEAGGFCRAIYAPESERVALGIRRR